MGLLNASQANIETTKAVRESFVIDPQAVQHGGVQVAQMDRVFGDVVAKIVGTAVFQAAANAAAGQPDREAAAMMVAPHVRVAKLPLGEDRASKLRVEEDQG